MSAIPQKLWAGETSSQYAELPTAPGESKLHKVIMPPDQEYRNYAMPPDDLNRTASKLKRPVVRVNGKIRAREVRVIAERGEQIGVISLTDALALAKAAKLDLVQVTSNIEPPICRIVDFGRYRYKLSKEAKKFD